MSLKKSAGGQDKISKSRKSSSSNSSQSSTPRPWSSLNKKLGKEDAVDMALLKTATSLAEPVKQVSESEGQKRKLEYSD